MSESMLVIRKPNKSVYKRFRQKALEEDLNLGDAITEAMRYWLDLKQKNKRPNPKNLLKLNGFIKVGKKVKWSEEIDQIVYGG